MHVYVLSVYACVCIVCVCVCVCVCMYFLCMRVYVLSMHACVWIHTISMCWFLRRERIMKAVILCMHVCACMSSLSLSLSLYIYIYIYIYIYRISNIICTHVCIDLNTFMQVYFLWVLLHSSLLHFIKPDFSVCKSIFLQERRTYSHTHAHTCAHIHMFPHTRTIHIYTHIST